MFCCVEATFFCWTAHETDQKQVMTLVKGLCEGVLLLCPVLDKDKCSEDEGFDSFFLESKLHKAGKIIHTYNSFILDIWRLNFNDHIIDNADLWNCSM